MVMDGSHVSSGESSVPSINTILFDLDNTLIFTREADAATCITVASWLESQGLSKEESREITTCFLHKFREAPAPDYPTDLAGLDKWRVNIWASVLPEIHHQYTEDVYLLWKQERLNQLSLKPTVVSMLQELATEFNLGLITNGPSVAQWEKINESGCQKFFNTIIVSGDFDVEKPNKYVYELACNELKVSPSECIMVGDKIETDIKGGINAGVAATVWVNTRNKVAPSDIQPDFTIVSVTKLPDILHDLTAAFQNEES